jgi:nicotinate dehydrogenase subunit B
LPDLKGRRDRAARQSLDAAHADRQGRCRRAIAAAAKPMHRTYVWPYQMHGSIGPSCAVADYRDDGHRVWSGTQNPHPARRSRAAAGTARKPKST